MFNMPEWASRLVSPHVLSIPAYVAGKPIAEVVRELGITDVIKMASNENALGPSPLALKAVEQHLASSHIYPESSAPALREAIAGHFGIDPTNVICGNGSDEIMALACHVFINENAEAIMGENSFSMYRICVEAFGGKPVRVPLKSYCSDLTSMAAAVTDRTRLLFLAVPNSPTGTIVSKNEFRSFLNDLPAEGLIVVLDEAYREFAMNPDCPLGLDYITDRVPVMVLRTFSKIYGLAGFRVGYGLAAPWIIELLNRVRAPFNVNSSAQVAAIAALNDLDHVRSSAEAAVSGRRYIATELNELGIETIPSEANFICFKIGAGAKDVYNAMLQKGVIVRHLASFGMSDWIRVTIGKPEENERFIEALKTIVQR